MNSYTRETPGGLILVARAYAKEGGREELLAILEEGVALVAEHEREGPLSATFSASATDPNLVVLIEHWPSGAALAEHQSLGETVPAYQAARERLQAVLSRPIEIVEVMRPAVRLTQAAEGQWPAAVVHRLVRAEANRDIDAYAACLAADVEVWINGRLTARSREAQRTATEATLTALPDWERETLGVHVDGTTVGLRWRGSGTHSAPWGGVPASGNRVEFHGTSWCEVVDGLINRIQIDMDMAGPLGQMSPQKESNQ